MYFPTVQLHSTHQITIINNKYVGNYSKRRINTLVNPMDNMSVSAATFTNDAIGTLCSTPM